MPGIRRRLRNDRGAVAVEFALILPVLLLILVGTIEFGRVYSQFQVYNGAAREGARCAAVQATDFADCDPVAKVAEASEPYATPTGVSVSTTCSDDNRGAPVTVSWNQSFEITIPFWGAVTPSRTISATFRCE